MKYWIRGYFQGKYTEFEINSKEVSFNEILTCMEEQDDALEVKSE